MMAIRKSEIFFTVEQYLEIERKTGERYEYLDGEILDMAGESDAHGEICANLAGMLHPQLRGTPCRMRIKDTKVCSGPKLHPGSTKGLFSYPDLVVICGELQHFEEHRDIILNPAVIIEVLSDSTESFDRGEKFHRYQMWNLSLSDYVLVAQSRPVIDHYARQADGSWSYRFYAGLEAQLEIATIHCRLPLVEIYDRVTFPPAEAEAEM
jgi:Uma2 family endonuclease